jgi:hypothetical protein
MPLVSSGLLELCAETGLADDGRGLTPAHGERVEIKRTAL